VAEVVCDGGGGLLLTEMDGLVCLWSWDLRWSARKSLLASIMRGCGGCGGGGGLVFLSLGVLLLALLLALLFRLGCFGFLLEVDDDSDGANGFFWLLLFEAILIKATKKNN
jgi:hypothetical protein